MSAPSEWDLLPEAYIVAVPSVNVVTGQLGPPGRFVVATKERAEQIVAEGPKKDGKPIRSYVRATEANLTPTEVAELKRAAREAAAAKG